MRGWEWRGNRFARRMLAVGFMVLLAGCAGDSRDETEAVAGQIIVEPGLNPDATGRPSPVRIRVYQLRDRDVFMDASLRDLLDKDVDTLGRALLNRDTFELCPAEMEPGDAQDAALRCQGENLPITLDLSPDVRFLAVMAEFYDVQDPASKWRAVAELPEDGFWDFLGSESFTITLDGSRVAVAFD